MRIKFKRMKTFDDLINTGLIFLGVFEIVL